MTPTAADLNACPEPMRAKYHADPARWGAAIIATARQRDGKVPYEAGRPIPGAFVIRSQQLAEWTGYGQATIALARHLDAAGLNVRFTADTTDERYAPLTDWTRGRVVRHAVASQLAFGTPFWAKGYTGPQFTMWEADRLPPESVANLNARSRLITPTAWGRDVLRDSGVTVPVDVCPLGVDSEVLTPSPLPEGPFTVLGGGRVTHGGTRKGHGPLTDAFLLAFGDNPDVRLRLKVWPDCLNQPEMRAVAADPRIILDSAAMSDADLAAWYASGHVFASASRGEGWGLMPHQAMACARPIVAAKWSATAEMMSDATGWPVAYELQPTPPDHPYESTGRWAVPDVRHLAHQLRAAYADRDAVRRKGEAARAWAARHTWAAAAKRLVEIVRPPLPPLRKQVASLMKAAASHVASGLATVTPEEASRRLAICDQCEHHRPESNRCGLCGCGLSLKVTWATQHCPDGRW
jgi:glycosyltransferase involved in cell wall biosynthesis